MRFLALSLLLGSSGLCCGQSRSPAPPNVVLHISLATDQSKFHIGETIPIQLSFSASVRDRYQVNMAQYDRSGRMEYERFILVPASRAVDPLAGRTPGVGGGLTGFKFLDAEPWTITLNLNEWLRFTQPGNYRLTVESQRVGVKDSSSPFGTSPVSVRSNEIALQIIPASEAWQKHVLTSAVATLDQARPEKPQDLEKYVLMNRRALETLRFLGTADAAKELAKRLRGENLGGLDYVCMLGLISSPERAVAQTALEHELFDPGHPISDTFLYTLRTLNTKDPENWREAQRNSVESLIAALPAKRGTALSVSLSTALNESWNTPDLPKQTTDKLVSQMVSMFDQLPLAAQNNLLTYRWDKIAGPDMLPILRRYAETYQDYREMREMNAYASLQLSASALQHWYELDPAGARPAIIREITRPRPRFDARVLGILPDKTLPEVDFPLAKNLTDSDDFEGLSHIGSLIARYATDAILPYVTEKLDPSLGKWACAVQDPLLAYILRVSPAMAEPRIEQAVAARGEGFSACNHELFQSISDIHYDPVLEGIAIHSLDDPDPQVAMTAATMLGKYGSPAAEPALWRSYSAWCESWAGHESELDLTFADSGGRVRQVGLGQNLMSALATARNWLSDESTLQRLLQLTRVKRVRDELDGYLELWESHPLVISFNNNPLPAGFEARVVQYEFHSTGELKYKLGQFPTGTKFVLAIPPFDSQANERTLAELRSFIIDHGMLVPREKRID
jgi:hypothetical protein